MLIVPGASEPWSVLNTSTPVKAEKLWAENYGGCWNDPTGVTRRVFYIPGTVSIPVGNTVTVTNGTKTATLTVTPAAVPAA